MTILLIHPGFWVLFTAAICYDLQSCTVTYVMCHNAGNDYRCANRLPYDGMITH